RRGRPRGSADRTRHGARHDRRAACRCWVEVPFGESVAARPGRRNAGGTQPVVNDELPTADEWEAAKQQPVAETTGGREATIAAELLQAVIDAARAGLPNESCGLLVGTEYAATGGSPDRYVALTNAAASPYRY